MKSELEAIHERTLIVLKNVQDMRSRENLSDEELTRLAGFLAELNELRPPERYAWVDGLPVIDIIGELAHINKQKEKQHMEAVERRKRELADVLLKKLRALSEGKSAIAGFEAAKAKIAGLKESFAQYNIRKSEIERDLQTAKTEARKYYESGKGIGGMGRRAGDLMVEYDLVNESIDQIEDVRLPEARQALEDSEKMLNKVIHLIMVELQAEIHEDLERRVADLEVLLHAWPLVASELHADLRKNSLVNMPPLWHRGRFLHHAYRVF